MLAFIIPRSRLRNYKMKAFARQDSHECSPYKAPEASQDEVYFQAGPKEVPAC